LGAAIVRRFAKEGWRCLVHCHTSVGEARDLCAELRAAGAAASLIAFDLADPAAIERGLSEAFEIEPGLRALVNCASVFAFDTAAAPSPAVWSQALAVNTLAPVLLAAGFAGRLDAQGDDACIVNILDQKLRNPNPDYFSYTLSKAALEAASGLMARAYAPRVRVANVAPGLVLPSGDQTDEEFERAAAMNLLQRRTGVGEVADAVFYAATRPYLTGQTLYVDSGQSLTGQPRDVMFLVRESDGE